MWEVPGHKVVKRVDERKRRVLQAIIDDYIVGAEPVGSRTIARKYQLGVSSATIRNEMADLEELGYLEQPHTSAGRIPSNKGYRYYVDNLVERPTLSDYELERISRQLQARAQEIHSLIQQSARILAEATDCLAVVTTPEFSSSSLRHIQVMPLRENKALLLMVSESGFTESKMIELPRPMSVKELQYISELLTTRLVGQSIASLKQEGLERLRFELTRYQDFLGQIFASADFDSDHDSTERLYMGGTSNILRQPEFRDVQKISDLLLTLEQQNIVYQLLEQKWEDQPIRVVIGEEIEIQTIQECSIVTTSYSIGGKTAGYIGVIGPRRMPYGRIIALVDAVTYCLNELLDQNF